jgi:cysteine sulfinate desulfinase/cysteine desulfurase-like protein
MVLAEIASLATAPRSAQEEQSKASKRLGKTKQRFGNRILAADADAQAHPDWTPQALELGIAFNLTRHKANAQSLTEDREKKTLRSA